MAGAVVKVKREILEACMTCPLCNKLFNEATTISKCLHTFAILKKIDGIACSDSPVLKHFWLLKLLLIHWMLKMKPVCKKCVYEKLADDEVDYCPVCHIDLGCLPVEKLRLVSKFTLSLSREFLWLESQIRIFVSFPARQNCGLIHGVVGSKVPLRRKSLNF
ncbi:hypothetical protein Patl1_23275 [Pistacia atlantica]|uniref:Uncharacterized protein n=1 Tax=Pistacia atlantica TaxID=434234 RepID=A0ACC0ZYQ5_9ROSI|nr:hypothetical protein Patl1_23275 [Pistacia atlantica]